MSMKNLNNIKPLELCIIIVRLSGERVNERNKILVDDYVLLRQIEYETLIISSSKS